jgi:hypothetical protein
MPLHLRWRRLLITNRCTEFRTNRDQLVPCDPQRVEIVAAESKIVDAAIEFDAILNATCSNGNREKCSTQRVCEERRTCRTCRNRRENVNDISDDESEELFHQKFKLLIELFEVKRCGVVEFDTAIANFTRGCKHDASVTMILEFLDDFPLCFVHSAWPSDVATSRHIIANFNCREKFDEKNA